MTTDNTARNPSETARVAVDLGKRSYEIVIGAGLLSRTASMVTPWCEQRLGKTPAFPKACVITDENVRDLHAKPVVENLQEAGWAAESVVLEPGEESKRLNVVSNVYDRLVAMRADRQTVVIAVGGGVVGDAAGFVAATYARGIPFVQVPTTLLAQVDSSVGGKVGINHPQGKNLIGAFHQPFGVVIDTQTLNTLPERDYRSGLAEVVKYGVILDEEFFAWLEQHVEELNRRDPDALRHVVARCCRLKADVVEADEEERTGLRAVLNYGHTFAHAFEALSGYGTLMHGEAVAIGMIYASTLAERLGRIPDEATGRQQRLLTALNLPVKLPTDVNPDSYEIMDRMRLDKKAAANRLRFVLPTRIGHVELVDEVPETEVTAVLEALAPD